MRDGGLRFRPRILHKASWEWSEGVMRNGGLRFSFQLLLKASLKVLAVTFDSRRLIMCCFAYHVCYSFIEAFTSFRRSILRSVVRSLVSSLYS